MKNNRRKPFSKNTLRRRGAATLDYILVIAATLPLLVFLIPNSKRLMLLIYEMFAVQVSWPFM